MPRACGSLHRTAPQPRVLRSPSSAPPSGSSSSSSRASRRWSTRPARELRRQPHPSRVSGSPAPRRRRPGPPARSAAPTICGESGTTQSSGAGLAVVRSVRRARGTTSAPALSRVNARSASISSTRAASSSVVTSKPSRRRAAAMSAACRRPGPRGRRPPWRQVGPAERPKGRAWLQAARRSPRRRGWSRSTWEPPTALPRSTAGPRCAVSAVLATLPSAALRRAAACRASPMSRDSSSAHPAGPSPRAPEHERRTKNIRPI